MSGIAGIFNRDGRPCDRADLHSMLERLAYRGPDGASCWVEDAVALGHVLLATVPAPRRDGMPLVARGDDLVLTGDLRLDNRDELMALLGVRPASGACAGDGALVLRAYQTWGEQCPAHLLGDFAFALWDGRRRLLFCARDHFGVKPFYFYQSAGTFAFASEIKALLALPTVPRRLNEARLADYLVPMLEDTRSTLYQGISHLSPGQCLAVRRADARERAYWSLDPTREVRLGSDAAYAEAFRDLFTAAVRCRLDAAGAPGSTLSGGLDSSSVTCVARDLLRARGGPLLLHTFSAIYDDVPSCDEREYIHAVVATGHLEPHYGHPDRVGPLTDWEGERWVSDEPIWNPQTALHWVLYQRAQEQGIHVVLDGFGGDSVVSHGLAYLAELARAGRWLRLSAEAAAVGRHFGISARGLAWRRGMRPLVPAPARKIWRRWRGRDVPPYRTDVPIRADFARRIRLADRVRRLAGVHDLPARSSRQEQWQELTSGHIASVSLPAADRTAALFAIEPRFPFLDRRLVEFCLALPAEQKMQWGWTRLVLRHAMSGVLPARVQWRPGKARLGPSFVRGLATMDRPLLDELILRHPEYIAEYVDVDALRVQYRRFIADGSGAFALWRVAMIARWLRRTGLTGSGT